MQGGRITKTEEEVWLGKGPISLWCRCSGPACHCCWTSDWPFIWHNALGIAFASSIGGILVWSKNEYPEISLCALKRLVPFGSTYLREAGFRALVCMRSKYRFLLDVMAEMRCALSTTAPDFEKLQRGVQAQPSHYKCGELRETIIIHKRHDKLKLKQTHCDTFHLSNLHCG